MNASHTACHAVYFISAAKSGYACADFFNDPSKVDTQDCGKRVSGMSGCSCADFRVQRIYAAGLYSDEHLAVGRSRSCDLRDPEFGTMIFKN